VELNDRSGKVDVQRWLQKAAPTQLFTQYGTFVRGGETVSRSEEPDAYGRNGAQYEPLDRLPGVTRFMVLIFDQDGERMLASPKSQGFMSVQEAGAWGASNLAEGTPFEIRRYTKGSSGDPNIRDQFEENAGPRGVVDEQAATELVLYIENTSELSLDGPRGQGRSVLLNALRKFRKGTYDSDKAVKLFEYLTEAGAKRYAEEMGNKRTWATMFNVPTRTAAARQLEESFRSSADQGVYDHVDTRIGQ
jgi:hypothetical protein